MELITPRALKKGDTIGVCTPSSPSYTGNPEMFDVAMGNIEKLGFKVKLGSLTAARASQGYRSGTPEDRAQEFMDLVRDDEVAGIMSTIGGANSNSMIPFLDFTEIRRQRKFFCGYSDVTSLHLAILHYAGLRTLYGTAAMVWFGDYPDGIAETIESFYEAITRTDDAPRELKPFPRWSNHFRDWDDGSWKTVKREWQENLGWQVLSSGEARGPLVAANLHTLCSSAGTPYFPELKDRILLIESMAAPYAIEERTMRQLQLVGAFDQIAGLIVGKPESPDPQGAPFSHNELIMEVVGSRNYPIISEFDCSHTVPMLTLGQGADLELVARQGRDVSVTVHSPFVSP